MPNITPIINPIAICIEVNEGINDNMDKPFLEVVCGESTAVDTLVVDAGALIAVASTAVVLAAWPYRKIAITGSEGMPNFIVHELESTVKLSNSFQPVAVSW